MTELIDKIIPWFIKQGEKYNKKSSGWKSTVGILIGILALGMVVVLSIRLWWRGRKLADALHERDVAEEEKQQILLEGKIDKISGDIELEGKKYREAFKKEQEAQKKLDRLDLEYKAERARLDAIENWKDFDKFVSRTGNTNGE